MDSRFRGNDSWGNGCRHPPVWMEGGNDSRVDGFQLSLVYNKKLVLSIK
jgi:hypothetical protein